MLKFENPDIIITDILARHAKWRADKFAIIAGDKRLTWQEFNHRINKVANALIMGGLRKGDKVCVLMTNSLEVPEIIFGTVKAGGVIVPLSTMLPGNALTKMIVDSDAKFLFADPETRNLINDYRTHLKNIPGQCMFSTGEGIGDWNPYSFLLQEASEEEPKVKLSYADQFNIMYTSGTTGVPKGIVHTHHSRLNFATMFGLIQQIDSSAISIVATALSTNGTWLVLLPTLFAGGTVVVMSRFESETFMKLVERQKGTHTFMVPTLLKMLIEESTFGTYDLSTMRTWLSAGSALEKRTKAELMRKLPGDLLEAYGCTEGVTTVLRSDDMGDKIGSVGLPPVGWDVRIIDDQGCELSRGEIGEIVGCTSFIMSEYYKLPEKTAETIWRNEQGETYVKTGDMGKLDEDGYLYILDRKKDMIISGGINIFAVDIEDVMTEHPAVKEVAVIAVPHTKWGETPLALVRLVQGTEIEATQLKEWVNARVGKYQRISAVEFRDEPFPRNTLGKLLKRQLRQPFWSD